MNRTTTAWLEGFSTSIGTFFKVIQGDAIDNVITHNLQLNLGVTVYLPPKAKRSRLESSSEGEVQKPSIDVSAEAEAGGDAGAGDDAGGEAEVGAPPPEEAAGDDTEEIVDDDEELIEEE